MATLKNTTLTARINTMVLAQTDYYAAELQQLKDSHEPRLKALIAQAEETKATCLALGLSEEDYNTIRNLLTSH